MCLRATLAVAALLTICDVEAEEAAEVVQKIRRGLEAKGDIEFWLAAIYFPPEAEKPAKELILAKLIGAGEPSPTRIDFLTPESEEGENSNAYVGLRYITAMPSKDALLPIGSLWQNSRRRSRKLKPYPEDRVRPDLPIPFLYLNLEDYLLKYKKWDLEGDAVFTAEEGNPRSLPKLGIKFLEKKGVYLISELVVEKNIKYEFLFHAEGQQGGGYEERNGMFRPTIISARSGDEIVVIHLEAVWFLPKEKYKSIFSAAGFSDMMSVSNLGGDEVAGEGRCALEEK